MPDRKSHSPLRLHFDLSSFSELPNGFADLTYEDARSVTGQFPGIPRPSAAVIGFTAGLGELLGNALRSFSGYLGDKTGWPLFCCESFVFRRLRPISQRNLKPAFVLHPPDAKWKRRINQK